MSISRRKFALGAAAGALVVAKPHVARAADKVRVSSAQRGNWDVTLPEWANDKGMFKAADLDIDMIWTDGGAEQVQVVVSGSSDIGMAIGFQAVLSAYIKGAPIVIISAEMTGAADLYWYARADSGIKTIADMAGRSVAFSRPGASTHLVITSMLEGRGIKAKLVPTGGIPATLTAVMTGQVDVGWGSVPQGFDMIEQGKIVMVASGNDAPGAATQTTRVNVANRNFAERKPELVKRYIDSYKKIIDWAYSTDDALLRWMEIQKLDRAVALKGRAAGFPKSALTLSPISGLDLTMQQAIEQKRLTKPMSPAEIDEMLKYVKRFAG